MKSEINLIIDQMGFFRRKISEYCIHKIRSKDNIFELWFQHKKTCGNLLHNIIMSYMVICGEL